MNRGPGERSRDRRRPGRKAPARGAVRAEARRGRSGPARAAHWGLTIPLLLVAAASGLAFWPSLRAEPVIDDIPIVLENPALARADLGEILTSGYWELLGNAEAGLYRPVTILSFVLERDESGRVSIGRAHGTNLLLHVLEALALGALLLRLGAGRIASLSAAALAGVHPIQVQSVSELVGRAELLAALFSLLALLAWTWTARWKPGEPWEPAASPATARAGSWAAAIFFLLAIGSKEVAAGTVLLLPAMDVLFRRPRRGEWLPFALDRATALAPVGLALLAYVSLRTIALESFPGFARIGHYLNPLVAMPQPDRLLTALGIAARYAGIFFFPLWLGAEYAGPAVARETSLLAPLPLAGLCLLLGLLALAVFPPFARRRPILAFSALLVLLPYAIVGNLFFPIGVSMALRVAHLPALGAAALAGAGIAALARGSPPRSRAVLAGLALGAALLAFRSFLASLDWQNEERLWRATMAAVPNNPTPYHVLGKSLAGQGRFEEALPLIERALALWPVNSGALYEKGAILASLGRLEAALPCFRESALLDPWYAPAQADLGIALHRLGRREEAERRLRYAMRKFPAIEKPVSELAALCFEDGRYEEAVKLYARAIALGRTDLAGRLEEARRLASAAAREGRLAKAAAR